MRLNSTYRVVSLCVDDRVDRRILDGARMLTEEGWPTLVVAGPPPGDLKDEESYPDVPVFRLMGQYVPPGIVPSDVPSEVQKWSAGFTWHRRVTAAALAFPAEVIIANDLPQLAAGIIAARRHGSTLIYDAHEFYPSQPFTKERTSWLEDAERALIKHADAIVTVNESIADILCMRYQCPRPRVVLNTPTRRHQPATQKDDGRLRKQIGVSKHTRVLLYQGNLAASRNLEPLIEGMKLVQTPNVVLALMGKQSAVGEALKGQAKSLGLLGKRVHFIPEQSAGELLAWTVGADAGIIPYPHSDINTWLVSPNKLFEFLAAGLPILSSHGPELRRFVGDMGVGINAHLSTPADFAAAIDQFFAGPLDAYRARAAEVASRFTWEVEGRQWFDIIRDAQAVHASRDGATGMPTVRPTTPVNVPVIRRQLEAVR